MYIVLFCAIHPGVKRKHCLCMSWKGRDHIAVAVYKYYYRLVSIWTNQCSVYGVFVIHVTCAWQISTLSAPVYNLKGCWLHCDGAVQIYTKTFYSRYCFLLIPPLGGFFKPETELFKWRMEINVLNPLKILSEERSRRWIPKRLHNHAGRCRICSYFLRSRSLQQHPSCRRT